MSSKRQKRAATSKHRPVLPPTRVGEISTDTFNIRFSNQNQVTQFGRIKTRKMVPTRYLDFDVLEALGIQADVEWLANQLGWNDFIHLIEPTYKGLTLEFLSTFEAQLFTGSRKSEGLCTFRLGNVDRELDLETANGIFGFPSDLDENVPRGERQASFCHAAVFWSEIGSGYYDATKSKATGISNPALRIFHRFMAHTIFGRGDGGENSASKKELVVLCAALYNHPINSAGFMMGHLSLVGSKASGDIAIGGLVTRIARYFNVNLDGRRDLIHPLPIGFDLLHNMKLLLNHHNTWYWALPHSDGKLLRLPCPERVTLQRRENWKIEPRHSDPTLAQLKTRGSSSRGGRTDEDEDEDDDDDDDDDDEVEAEDEDEDEDYAPGHEDHYDSDPRLYSLIESMQRDMTQQFTNMNTRIDQLHDKFDEWRASGWQPGPPPPPQE